LLSGVAEAFVARVASHHDLLGAGGLGDRCGAGVRLAGPGMDVAGSSPKSPRSRAPRIVPSPGRLVRISAAGCWPKCSATTCPRESTWVLRVAMSATWARTVAAWRLGGGCRSSSARRTATIWSARASGSRRRARVSAVRNLATRQPCSGVGIRSGGQDLQCAGGVQLRKGPQRSRKELPQRRPQPQHVPGAFPHQVLVFAGGKLDALDQGAVPGDAATYAFGAGTGDITGDEEREAVRRAALRCTKFASASTTLD